MTALIIPLRPEYAPEISARPDIRWLHLDEQLQAAITNECQWEHYIEQLRAYEIDVRAKKMEALSGRIAARNKRRAIEGMIDRLVSEYPDCGER
jgi:hypothetical protein